MRLYRKDGKLEDDTVDHDRIEDSTVGGEGQSDIEGQGHSERVRAAEEAMRAPGPGLDEPFDDVPPEMAGRRSPDFPCIEVRKEHGQWVVRDTRGRAVQRALRERSKAAAIARALAREEEAVLILYDEEGRIEEEQDYGSMGIGTPTGDARSGPRGQRAVEKDEERMMR